METYTFTRKSVSGIPAQVELTANDGRLELEVTLNGAVMDEVTLTPIMIAALRQYFADGEVLR